MPTQHSKFFIYTTCKEYSHPWSDSCINTNAGLGVDCLEESLKLYTTVYLAALLMRGKVPTKDDIKKTVLGILQSTAFLTWSGFSFSTYICVLRRLCGWFTFYSVSYIPSLLSSFTAILIERPSRRPLLSLYVANIATETLFRMGVSRGYFSPIPRGETYIFAASMAFLLYLYRSKENKPDSVHKIIRLMIGPYEDAVNLQKGITSAMNPGRKDVKKDSEVVKKKSYPQNLNILFKSLQVYKRIIDWLKTRSKHVCCPHPHSCAHYILAGTGRTFIYGICGQLVMKVVLQMRKYLFKPRELKAAIWKRENLKLAMFFGGFTGLYRLVSCSLRRLFNDDSPYYAIPAGFISGMTFTAYPSSTIALYFMWKTLQLYWNHGVENGLVPEVKWFVIFLYCVSTALLFHTALLEPMNLRPSYWKFLHTLSGGRVSAMSRIPLDTFGLQSSKQLKEVLIKTNTKIEKSYRF